jgi:hypothetical protein
MTGSNSEIRGSGELTARLLWFRSDHPEGEIETELVVAETDMAVCRTSLRTQTAGSASAHGSALRDETGARYVEIAEDRSLARALTALGYGSLAEDSDEDDEANEPAPPIEMVSARSLLREDPVEPEYREPQRIPQQIRETAPESGPEAQADETKDETKNEGADVSWNKFWTWARQRGYTNARELNELLGVDNVLAFTPREVRQMLVKYEMDNPPGGQSE